MAVSWNHDKKWGWSLQVVWLRHLSLARWCWSLDPHCEEELGETCLISSAAHKRKVSSYSSCDLFQPCASFAPSVSGYRHVYLEGIEEASIFVHVAINDICGKVSVSVVCHTSTAAARIFYHTRKAQWVKVQADIFVHSESNLSLCLSWQPEILLNIHGN